MHTQQLFSITENSQIAEARRVASEWTRAIGFNETETGKLALVVTEAATNLLKHAGRGQLIIRVIEQEDNAGLELLALDQGPGIADIQVALRDGYSTTGSSGTGLGAIRRLAHEFDLYSRLGLGTALLARFWRQQHTTLRPPLLQLGVVSVPKMGEQVCGDGWRYQATAEGFTLLVADGLGHGPEAAKAAQAACETLYAQSRLAPVALLEAVHGNLRSTRGAAVAIAEVKWAQPLVRFAGVGNISALVLEGSQRRHLVSHNGIVGYEMRKVQEFTAAWSANALLILHSDGLTTHWDLATYPGLLTRDPTLIAGILYRDFTRGRDDATVVVVKAY